MLGLIVVIALLFYVGANSLFSKVIAVVRSSVRDVTLPLELMALPFRLLVSLVGLAILVRYVPVASDIKELLHHTLLIVAIIGLMVHHAVTYSVGAVYSEALCRESR
jgi:hypothetical protein